MIWIFQLRGAAKSNRYGQPYGPNADLHALYFYFHNNFLRYSIYNSNLNSNFYFAINLYLIVYKCENCTQSSYFYFIHFHTGFKCHILTWFVNHYMTHKNLNVPAVYKLIFERNRTRLITITRQCKVLYIAAYMQPQEDITIECTIAITHIGPMTNASLFMSPITLIGEFCPDDGNKY